MKFKDAVSSCHVRSGIYRKNDPMRIYTLEDLTESNFPDIDADKVGKPVMKVYWFNVPMTLEDQVPEADKAFDDWEEYDPREQPDCSAYGEMPA